MDWHVVGPLNPLDLYDDCAIPLDDFIASKKNDWHAVAEVTAAMKTYEEGAEIKNQALRGQPHVFFDPFSDTFGLVVKQDSNGTTYLVVRNPEPYAQLMRE